MVDEWFAAHKAHMNSTHNFSADGSKEPHALCYYVSKVAQPGFQGSAFEGPHSSNHTLYALTETYRSREGCVAHTDAGSKQPQLHSRDVCAKYGMSIMMAAPVMYTHSAPLLDCLQRVKPGCVSFDMHLLVPAGPDEAKVDAWFARHCDMMRATHSASSGPEPCVLFYTVSKTPEPEQQNFFACQTQGTTGKIQYCLSEVYASREGMAAHFETARKHAELFAEYERIREAFCTCAVADAVVLQTM